MKKVAIFVEGDTEFFFVEKLIQEVAGYGKIKLVMMKQHGNAIHFVRDNGTPDDVATLEVLLVNCCCDVKVKSSILERAQLLANKGYTYILGLQDLFPRNLDDLEKYEAGIATGLDAAPLPVKICLAVKEVEAWFLNEAGHFTEINSGLNRETIVNGVQFDPVDGNAEMEVKHPAVLLDKIYQLVGLRYQKHSNEIHRLIAALNFGSLYYDVRQKSKSLDSFLKEIDEILAEDAEAVAQPA
jgi:hypothetical protein